MKNSTETYKIEKKNFLDKNESMKQPKGMIFLFSFMCRRYIIESNLIEKKSNFILDHQLKE